jgi:two-component system heavy metal sensor histidine kinase CusS
MSAESDRKWSIGGSLIAISTAAGCATLAVAFLFLNQVVRTHSQREWSDLIVSELVFIDSELRSAEEGEESEEIGEIRYAIETENRTRFLGTFYLEILDRGHQPMLRTEGMEALVAQAAPFPAPASTVENAEMITWTDREDRFFVLTAVTVPVRNESRIVHLALDGTRTRDSLVAYRDASIGVVIVGTLGFGLAVMAATRRAFRPLVEITNLAERIGVDHLGDRIGARQWPVELARLAAAFDGMLDRLATSIMRLEQFSADIAHELRTPVNNIMGETEVTLHRPRSAAEYREALESNLEEAGRLRRIIESLLFLARAEAGSPLPGEHATVDLRPELESIAGFFQPQAEELGVSVSVRGSGRCRADRDLLRRAVVNLMSNALHFSESGDSITLEVTEADDRSVVVSVTDTGCGIPPEHLPKVFDRFFRGDRSRSRQEGSGLGLAIVKTIMQLHGGEVLVASEPGKGSRFSLVFPAGG